MVDQEQRAIYDVVAFDLSETTPSPTLTTVHVLGPCLSGHVQARSRLSSPRADSVMNNGIFNGRREGFIEASELGAGVDEGIEPTW